MTTARRKRELDAHARDMQWDWVNEEDLKVFAKVSRGWFVGELAEERVRGGGGGGGGGAMSWGNTSLRRGPRSLELRRQCLVVSR